MADMLKSRIIFCLLLGLALPAGAADQTAARQAELAALQARIADIARAQQQAVDERDSLTIALRRTEKTLARLNAELTQLETELAGRQAHLSALRHEQAGVRATLSAHKAALGEQVRAAYLTGRQERLKLLLNQEDPVRLGRMLVYYDYLNRARSVRINTVRAQLERLLDLARDIAAEVTALDSTRAQRVATARQLEDQRAARAATLAKLDRQIHNQDTELTRLRADERALADLIRQLRNAFADIPDNLGQGPVFSAARGRLPWPVQGRLLHRYGEARIGGRLDWQGLTIAATAGSQVRAVARGRVAYADWLPHFGLLVILEHGDGYMSLYGHNQQLSVEAGDWVDAGQAIAAVGDSGGQVSAALYFEIRKDGKPVNPNQWLTKQ